MLYYVYITQLKFLNSNENLKFIFCSKFPIKNNFNNSIFKIKSFSKKNYIISFKFFGILKRKNFSEILNCFEKLKKELKMSLKFIDEKNNIRIFQSLNNYKKIENDNFNENIENIKSESLNVIIGKAEYKCVKSEIEEFKKSEIVKIIKSEWFMDQIERGVAANPNYLLSKKNFFLIFSPLFTYQIASDLRFKKYLDNLAFRRNLSLQQVYNVEFDEFLTICFETYIDKYVKGNS